MPAATRLGDTFRHWGSTPDERRWQRALDRALPFLDWIMMRRQLLNLKRLAERSAAP